MAMPNLANVAALTSGGCQRSGLHSQHRKPYTVARRYDSHASPEPGTGTPKEASVFR